MLRWRHAGALALLLAANAAASPAAAKMIGTYWTTYATDYPVEKLDFSVVNAVQYFASGLSAQATLDIDDGLAKGLVKKAHAAGATVTLTVGGWTDSKYFSPVAADAGLVKAFADQLEAAVATYGFDGVELDWESPSVPAADGNIYTDADSTNYIALLKSLRQALPKSVQLSAAGAFNGLARIDDYTEYASYLNYLVVMAYDLDLKSSGWTAPTAPLHDCNSNQAAGGSASSAIAFHRSKGFPASKLVLGIPTYGHSYSLNAPAIAKGNGTFQYQAWKAPQPTTEVTFSGLIRDKILEGDGVNPGSNGSWTRYFDECTQTPVLYDNSQKMLIAYDDPQSVKAKAALARDQGLKGVIFFAASGDSNDLLAQAAQEGLQGPPPPAALIAGLISAGSLLLLMLAFLIYRIVRRRRRLDEKPLSTPYVSPQRIEFPREGSFKSDMTEREGDDSLSTVHSRPRLPDNTPGSRPLPSPNRPW